MKHRHESLADFPVVITLPVRWGDQDAFGHVNNTEFIRWFESARVAYLERTGLWQMLAPDGIGPILAAISCNYRQPVAYPDTVHIGARVSRIGKSSFRMEHCVVADSTNAVCAEGDSTIVVLDYRRHKSIPIPGQVRQAIEELEGKKFE